MTTLQDLVDGEMDHLIHDRGRIELAYRGPLDVAQTLVLECEDLEDQDVDDIERCVVSYQRWHRTNL